MVLEDAWLDDFVFEECQLKGKGEGGENYLSYKRYRTTQKTESK